MLFFFISVEAQEGFSVFGYNVVNKSVIAVGFVVRVRAVFHRAPKLKMADYLCVVCKFTPDITLCVIKLHTPAEIGGKFIGLCGFVVTAVWLRAKIC